MPSGTKAVWSTEYINDLPDTAFAAIEPGGEKDDDGKTKPRSLRHFPHHDDTGKVDEAHVRNALGRIPQSTIAESLKEKALAHVKRHAEALGIDVSDDGKAYTRAAAPGRQYTKALLAGTRKAEDGGQVYTFRITSEAVDRDGEIITADGWEMENFRANPVILDSHNYYGIENIVGRATNLYQEGTTWNADIRFNDTPRGKLAAQLVDAGDLRAVSVGFMPKEIGYGTGPDGTLRHLQKELLEISVVPVPANQEALRLRGLGATSRPEGLTFDAQAEEALTSASALVARARALAGLRAKEGRPISTARRTRLEADAAALRDAAEHIEDAADDLDALLGETAPPDRDEQDEPEKAAAERARKARLLALRTRTLSGLMAATA